MPEGGVGALGSYGIGWDQGPRQRLQTQGDELGPDEDRRTGTCRRGRSLAG